MYIPAKKYFPDGTIDWDTHDIRMALVMTNTTADTETDKALMNAFSTLDEFDGSGYTREVFTNEAVNQDTPNNRSELDADDATFGALGSGTRSIQGAIIYKHVTNDGDSIPIAYIDLTPAFNPGGGTVTVSWDAQGIIQFT